MNGNTPALQRSNTPILITGLGLVTPLGWRIDEVWRRLCTGETGVRSTIELPRSGKVYPCARVEGFTLDEVVRTPRVRRSSAISHFAVGAAGLALRDAQLQPHPRVGVITAVTIGGVSYSRRFHQEFVEGGGANASPMLFPETVFNAPASHIAAVFGLDQTNYTLIGDGCCAANALAMACDLIGAGILEQCLVVGCEELDWIILEGYRVFGLVSPEAPRPFARPWRGFAGGEGAVAVLLESADAAAARSARVYARLRSWDRGFPFHHRRAIPGTIRKALANAFAASAISWGDVGAVVSSANGSFLDLAEADALAAELVSAAGPLVLVAPKTVMGEAHAASCLLQIAVGALAIRHGQVPPTVGTGNGVLDPSRLQTLAAPGPLAARNVLALCVGINEQVSVVVLSEA